MKTLRIKLACRAGLTLVELMLAMLISLVVLGGVHQVFVGSTTNQELTDQISRIQENGRFATHVLRSDLLNAGYLGCLQDESVLVNTLNNTNYFVNNYNQSLYGLEATSATAWADDAGTVDPAATGAADMDLGTPVGGSDILVVRGINGNNLIETTAQMKTRSDTIDVSAGLSALLPNGTILLATDCEGAAVFRSTNYDNGTGELSHGLGAGTAGNSTTDLGHAFAAGAQLLFPQRITYYIRNNGAGEPSLFRKVGSAAAEELVEGVENMQVRYGEDTDGDRDVDVYRAANAVNDWGDVVSVRLGLLMRSTANIVRGPADTNAYDIDGDGTNDVGAANDQRQRLVVTATVGLRNRLR